MLRTIVAVVVGFVGWGLVFNGFYLGLTKVRPETFAEDLSTADGANLVILLVWSAVTSVIIGWLAGFIGKSTRAVLAVGVVNLLAGIGFQIMNWEMYPVWYHIPFLVLVLPMTLAGGRLAVGK